MSSSLSNIVFNTVDRFAEAAGGEEETKAVKADTSKKVQQGIVHLRTQQRNGRKCLTIVQGLATDLDLQKILKVLRKVFSTNGTILKDEDHGEIIQLQGDRRKDVSDFLTKYNIVPKDLIKVHGF